MFDYQKLCNKEDLREIIILIIKICKDSLHHTLFALNMNNKEKSTIIETDKKFLWLDSYF